MQVLRAAGVTGTAAASALARAAIIAVGFGAMVLADVRMGFPVFVSESATRVAPGAVQFRAGLWAVTVGILLLSFAVRRSDALAAMVLAFLAAPAAFTSGLITCTPGCPLPPYSATTNGNLLHAGASIVSLAALGLTIMLISFRQPTTVLGQVARLAQPYAVLLLSATAVALVVLGHQPLTGVLERASLAVVFGWLLVTSIAIERDTAREATRWPTVGTDMRHVSCENQAR